MLGPKGPIQCSDLPVCVLLPCISRKPLVQVESGRQDRGERHFSQLISECSSGELHKPHVEDPCAAAGAECGCGSQLSQGRTHADMCAADDTAQQPHRHGPEAIILLALNAHDGLYLHHIPCHTLER